MSSVDNRIVNMQFDNKQFENGVQTTLSSLDKLKQGLNLTESAKNLTSLQDAGNKFSLSELSNSVELIASRFTTLGIIGVTALQNITNSAINAGKQLVKSLTIDPIKTGFTEYELKMNSVQTIMAGTGESLAVVNKYLEELNEYSDRTIYSFADMTQNIGKFTNAGVKLDLAVSSIKGIANVAAVSGANANEAARAMYNFSQALSQGNVKLIDWKSIELANMGTAAFKQQIIDTAVSMGTLTKASDGTIKTLKGTTVSTKDFMYTLDDLWFTSDVLTTTLTKYTDETTDLGKSAIAAAQDVKTFTQMIGTMKEAAQSGWAQTWEIVFGNFEEGKTLWTEVNNVFGAIISSSADARNSLLKGWKELGGREDIIIAIKNAFNGLLSILKPIKEAFKEIFPATTSQQLYNFTLRLKELSENFKIGEETAKKIKDVFKGLFSVLNIGVLAASALIDGVMNLGYYFAPLSDLLLTIASAFGRFATNVRDAADNTNFFNDTISLFGKILKPIGDLFRSFVEGFKNSVPLFINIATIIGQAFKVLSEKITESMKNTDFNAVFDTLNAGLFSVILFAIKKFIDNMSKILSSSKGLLDGLKSILDGVRGSLEAWQSSLKAKTLLTIASALAILVASIIALSLVDPKKLTAALSAISILFLELMGSMSVFNKIVNNGGFTSVSKITISMIGLATAILLLSNAVRILGQLNWKQLTKGLGALGIILAELALFLKSKNFKDIKPSTALALVILAGAINLLALAVARLGNLSVKQIIKGIGSIGILLAELVLFSKLGGGAKGMISISIGFMILSSSLLILAKAVKELGSMTKKELAKGMIAIASALTIIGVAMRLMPKNMIANSVALLAISTSLVILSKAMETMSKMSSKEIIKSLIALGGAMLIIAVAVNVMKSALGGAAALLIVSASLAILAGVLKTLGSMSLEEIGKSLLAMAGAFVVIGLAAVVLGPIVPVILALAASIALLGVGILAIGAGMLAFSAGLTALSISGVAAAVALTAVFTALIGLIPLFFIKVAEGIIAFADIFIKGVPKIAAAVYAIVVGINDVLIKSIPLLLVTVVTFIQTILNKIVELLPQVIQTGIFIITSFMTAIRDNIYQVTVLGIEIILEFLNGISSKMEDIIQTALNVIITFIDGLAEAIRNNQERIRSAVWNLITSIVSAITSFFGDIIKIGKDLIDQLVQSIKDEVSAKWDEMVQIGKNVMEGLKQGVLDMASSVANAAKDVVRWAVDGVKNFLGIRSPSKLMTELGEYWDQGFINGLNNLTSKVRTAAVGVGETAMDGISSAISKVSEVINSDMDLNPVITPVIDLTNVEKGISTINGEFGKSRSLSLASAVSSKTSDLTASINGVLPNIPAQSPTYIFNQNNYSPTALSRIDIYRQTKNQFSTLKGLVEGT